MKQKVAGIIGGISLILTTMQIQPLSAQQAPFTLQKNNAPVRTLPVRRPAENIQAEQAARFRLSPTESPAQQASESQITPQKKTTPAKPVSPLIVLEAEQAEAVKNLQAQSAPLDPDDDFEGVPVVTPDIAEIPIHDFSGYAPAAGRPEANSAAIITPILVPSMQSEQEQIERAIAAMVRQAAEEVHSLEIQRDRQMEEMRRKADAEIRALKAASAARIEAARKQAQAQAEVRAAERLALAKRMAAEAAADAEVEAARIRAQLISATTKAQLEAERLRKEHVEAARQESIRRGLAQMELQTEAIRRRALEEDKARVALERLREAEERAKLAEEQLREAEAAHRRWQMETRGNAQADAQ